MYGEASNGKRVYFHKPQLEYNTIVRKDFDAGYEEKRGFYLKSGGFFGRSTLKNG